MRTVIVALMALGMSLTGCTVAYNSQQVGEEPYCIPESMVMSEANGEDVVVSYRNGSVASGVLLDTSVDSLRLETESGIRTFHRAGIAGLKVRGSVAGAVLGFVLGAGGGMVAGGFLGGAIASSGGGFEDLFDGFRGFLAGALIGGVGGGVAGIIVGRNATAGTLYAWPQEQ